ncbi:hypothetical protein KR067_010720, partial [Drosophila pandora]
MEELYANNLKEEMTVADFKKSVHFASKPWTAADGGTTNLTLEVSGSSRFRHGPCLYKVESKM